MIDVAPPPAIYIAEPPRTTIELRLPPDKVDAVCRGLGVRGRRIYGCAVWGDGGCLIVVPKDVAPRDQAVVREHEIAHCNGWPKGHPSQ